jgi:signal transduction histidine kinase
MMMVEAPEQRRAAAQQLEDAIARASHLIRQLLELARIDNGEPQPDELLDLCQVARHAMAEMAPLAMQRQIELELDAPDALVRHIDRHAFLSILHNLLANAVQYSHKQGQVLVALAATDKAIVLSVSDDGPGIAEDQRTLVFERFYRVPGSASPGSGLGLPIVAQAVAGLHGSVRLENGLNGRGCRFTVELPLE